MTPPDAAAAAPRPQDPPVCSARGCRRDPAWALVWNNPRIHTPERRKVWLACDEHRERLVSFLSARSFLREVVPFTELAPDDGA